MQLTVNKMSFDQRKVELILKTENKFITDLFSLLPLPTHSTGESESVVL